MTRGKPTWAIERIEEVLASALTGAAVVTATDGDGQYITRHSARQIAELIGTDVADQLDMALKTVVGPEPPPQRPPVQLHSVLGR